MARPLYLGCLTVFDVPPPDMVTAAADAGYHGVSLAAGPRFLSPALQAKVNIRSVIDDAELRRETVRRARDTGVVLDLMEGIIISETFDRDQCRQALDLTAEMGIGKIAGSDSDPDRRRAADNLAVLCDMAQARGMTMSLEPVMHTIPPTVTETSAAITASGITNLQIMADVLHMTRVGEPLTTIARVPPQHVMCVQFCDGPPAATREAYAVEMVKERQLPGDGQLPLTEMLNVMPDTALIYVEVPQGKARSEGVSATGRARRAFDAMQRLMVKAGKAS
jgi:sugar phosphate isomerase/epimerase